MAQFYNLVSYQASGDVWSNEYGSFQTYWAQFEGIEGGVMLSKKAGTAPALGQVYGDLIQATSAKGNAYWKFKTQQVPQGTPRPATAVTNPVGAPAPQPVAQPIQGTVGVGIPGWFVPYGNMIEFIYKEMKAMSVQEEAPAPAPEPVSGTPVVGEPVSAADLATIDEIFGA